MQGSKSPEAYRVLLASANKAPPMIFDELRGLFFFISVIVQAKTNECDGVFLSDRDTKSAGPDLIWSRSLIWVRASINCPISDWLTMKGSEVERWVSPADNVMIPSLDA